MERPSGDKYTISAGKSYVLSNTSGVNDPVDFTIKGSGQTVYLTEVGFGNVNLHNTILVTNIGGVLSGAFGLLTGMNKDDINKNNHIILDGVYPFLSCSSITKSGTSYTLHDFGGFLLDRFGGYWTVTNADYTLNSDDFLILSATSGSFTDINLKRRGNGQQVYLYKGTGRHTREDYKILVFNHAGQIISAYNIIENQIFESMVIGDVPENNFTRERLGVLPVENFETSPLADSYEIFAKLRDKRTAHDVTIVQLGDSISTNDYATGYSDAAYRPCRMDERYLPALLEEMIRWKGQEYRRSDAKVNKSSSTNMFTEVCTSAENKYYDAAWDWQFDTISQNWYKVWTRLLEGSNCSVSFTIPKGTKNAAFIYRTD